MTTPAIRAALAEPPTDEQLLESAAKALGYKSIPSDETCLTAEASELLDFARAVLARWGRPTVPPAPEASNFDPRLIALATTSEQIPPGLYSEHELQTEWDAQVDEYNQWESLDSSEQLAWAQARAIAADRNGRPAAPPAPEVLSAEVKELVAALKEPGDPFPEYRTITSEQADRIAALLQQQQHLLGLAGAELDRFMEKQSLNIIFTGPPGPGNDCVFVEVETDDGRSVKAGEWSQRQDGYWALRLSNSITSPGSSEVTDDDLRTTFIEGAEMWLNDDVLMPGLRLIADRFCSSPAPAVVPLKERPEFIAGYRAGLVDGRFSAAQERAQRIDAHVSQFPPLPQAGEVEN